MVSSLPVLYSPRMAEEEDGPLRKRTYMALMQPLVPSPALSPPEAVPSLMLR